MAPKGKIYDRAYFDRWYRDNRFAVVRQDLVEWRVHLAVSVAEYLLEHPIRTVLDVGCGEAPWRAHLRRLRPRVKYTGVDSSEYAVKRYGRSRNIRLGTLGNLASLDLDGPYDLIVCSDVLHYVPASEVRRGLRAMTELLVGVAFIEVFAREDDTEGDHIEFQQRSAASYRKMIREAGLTHVGMHCFVGEELEPVLLSFERGWNR